MWLSMIISHNDRCWWLICRPPLAETFSRPTAQPVTTHNGVRACVVSSPCPVSFSSPATLRLPVHNTGHRSQPPIQQVNRPVKSRSYRHSGRTDGIHRCCYECHQRSRFTENNAKPSFRFLFRHAHEDWYSYNPLVHCRLHYMHSWSIAVMNFVGAKRLVESQHCF